MIQQHLLQSTLFVVAAWLLILAMKRNSAALRYWIWFSASIKFLIPFSWLTDLGSQFTWRTASEVAPAPYFLTLVSPEPVTPSSPPLHPSGDPLTTTLASIWLCGVIAGAIWWLRQWLQIRAIKRTAQPLSLNLPIPARATSTLLEPGVFGIFNPVLLLPEGITTRLTPEQLDAVIAHELSHVRRRDNLTATLHMAVETIFWFHPLVWIIRTRLIAERERACDEAVLQQGAEPSIYAEGILNVCKLYVASPLPSLAGVTGSSLKTRIEAILTNRPPSALTRAKRIALALSATFAVALPIVIGILNAPPIHAQSDTPNRPAFDVVSVKPCKPQPNRMRGGGDSSPGRLSIGCELLADTNSLGLIQRAYVRFAGGRPHPFGVLPVKGGPKWLHSELFEINARAESNPSLAMMQGPMLQRLLEDRFKLKLHRDTRQGPVYELTVARGGPKLKPFTQGACTQMPTIFPLPALPPGQRFCHSRIALLSPSIQAEGNTLTEFSTLLSLVLDRPVIDKTGLTQRFDINLEFARDQATPGLTAPPADLPALPPSDNVAPGIFTAIQEQLGLRLAPAKGPVEFLVIDHLERPAAN